MFLRYKVPERLRTRTLKLEMPHLLDARRVMVVKNYKASYRVYLTRQHPLPKAYLMLKYLI